MGRCFQCQRDPDEYDRCMRRLAKEAEVAKEAAIALGERVQAHESMVTELGQHLTALLDRATGVGLSDGSYLYEEPGFQAAEDVVRRWHKWREEFLR